MFYSSLIILLLFLLCSDEVTQELIVALVAPLCLFEKGGTKVHFFSASVPAFPQILWALLLQIFFSLLY